MSPQPRRRPDRRPHRQARPIRHDQDYGAVAAWCAGPDDLEAAKQDTHDAVIAMLGETRTGGVKWLIMEGDAALAQLSQMWEGADEPTAAFYRRIRGHLREWGGWLVVAIAPGRRP